ncbi:copper resistance protein NlpE N-terminal domain-containing protein [Siansivirga zeaxanthinifaciens]|uniref:NlpE C-terminal OB domain-containing protein n=1 Tax=Siansivirga zeaxanthinifaciens CC-SAMT-1 TaxID=1454006 RepID=A0A0C5W0I3_9FLAO|nr:copper resistance protein NlpE N-terminal domain-containing protein [Siansivirga zeaxanthinifaciens]AJR04771.1 hypothetical protein AW14_04025 [Siansivirga zeaxanthinifaciens CC-SAMT-1]
MRLIISTLILISNLTLFSQSINFYGDYYRSLGKEGVHFIEYKLTLNQDGTFIFHSYSNNKQGIPPEVNKYGKGKWIAKDKVITFFSNKQKDFDEKYTLDFNNSKARFVTKHPRDKTDRIIKPKLQFFESEIFWIKTIDIFKI